MRENRRAGLMIIRQVAEGQRLPGRTQFEKDEKGWNENENALRSTAVGAPEFAPLGR